MNRSNSRSQVIMAGGIAGNRVVTREMVYARTREMAVQAGRTSLQIVQRDYELARAELTGESDMDRQEAVLDSAPRRVAMVLAAATWENEGGRLTDCAA